MARERQIGRIGDYFDLIGGYAFKSDDFIQSGVPVIKIKNVKANRMLFDDLSYVSPQFLRDRADKVVQPGDLLITMSGNRLDGSPDTWVGKVAQFNEGSPYLLNQRVGILRPKPSVEVERRFFSYSLSSDFYQKEFIAIATSSGGQANLSPSQILSAPIEIPVLSEQRTIARILGAFDDKIELSRRMNETLEGMARALFKSWFVDFDPVRAKLDGRPPSGLDPATAALFSDGFEDSSEGLIPMGWQVNRLEELTSKIGSGATPRGGDKVYVQQGVALVRSQNVYDYEFVWNGLAHITEDAAAALDGVALEAEDILFNITGASILRTCVVDPSVLPARVNQHVARIRAKPGVPSRFLHLHLVRQEMKDHLIGFNAGATREAITKGHVQSIRIVVPPQEILNVFGELVKPLYELKQNSCQQSVMLAAIRDALLPKLLSGEIRMPAAEKLVEAAS